MQNVKVFYCYDKDVLDILFNELIKNGFVVDKVSNEILSSKDTYLQTLLKGREIVRELNIAYGVVPEDIYGKAILLDFIKIARCSSKGVYEANSCFEYLNDRSVVPPFVFDYAMELQSALGRKISFMYNNIDSTIDLYIYGKENEREELTSEFKKYNDKNKFIWSRIDFYDSYGKIPDRQYTAGEFLVNILSYFEDSYACQMILLGQEKNAIRSKKENPKVSYKDVVYAKDGIKISGECIEKHISFSSLIKLDEERISLVTDIFDENIYEEEYRLLDGNLVHESQDFGRSIYSIPDNFHFLDGIETLRFKTEMEHHKKTK